ncbi:hypothetical protein SAMN05216296_1039 [Pseudomonas pohangensis]|uniref:Uncharacterized protein n=1 Tax=Pseudomonas pohangensis TaxID=364197 RepID=A0A1H2ESB1_9PSED|nr:hypothetical protein [Pseudomonas pohangensis]SDT98052.1 hypothetical protein SAMN05216296_1039 [Pseudomonas pohangensis]
MEHSHEDLDWHTIYEGSGSVADNSWIEEVAYLGSEKWLLRLYDDPAWSFEPEAPMEPEAKTSQELVAWVESIDSASDEDVIEKPRQKSLYEAAVNSGAKECAELLENILRKP